MVTKTISTKRFAIRDLVGWSKNSSFNSEDREKLGRTIKDVSYRVGRIFRQRLLSS